MTRINVGICPKLLLDEHLLAEHREIKRLKSNLKKSIECGSIKKLPQQFQLGKGHVLFFLNKFQYLKRRYKDLYAECEHRGFNISNYESNFDVDKIYFNNYCPSESDINLIKKRILDKISLSNKKSWHYYGQVIDLKEYTKLLLKVSNQIQNGNSTE